MDSTAIALQSISQQLTDLARQITSLTIQINALNDIIISRDSTKSRQAKFNNQWFKPLDKADLKGQSINLTKIDTHELRVNCCG